MLIRQAFPTNSWTKIDKYVFTLDISAGAKVLYGFMFGMAPNSMYTDKMIMEELRLSQATLTRYKRELKDAKLLLVVELLPRQYAAYLGNTRSKASDLRAKWAEEDCIQKKPNHDK